MKWKRESWAVYVAALAVTVLVLICGQLLWQKYAMAKPLDKGLKGIQGVEAAVWEEAGKGSEVVLLKVVLGKVDKLENTYQIIGETARKILGRKAFRIEISDHRTPELEELFYKVNFNIQEAISTGNFAVMADRVNAQARDAGVEARVYVDAQNVYVQLVKGSGSLYQVVPRLSPGLEVK